MFFFKERFKKYPYNYTLYIKIEDGGKLLIIWLYVDDFIFIENDSAIFEKFKKFMMAEFDISDLEKMHYFLNIEVLQSVAEIFVSQRKCVRNFEQVSNEEL